MIQTLLYPIIVGAGVSVALQQILNAKLRLEIGSPWWAGVVSFLVGTLIMLAGALLTGPRPTWDAVSRISWTSLTGGFFGAVFIGTAILTVPRLGAATVFALVIVGQMLGSLVFDHFGLLGVAQHDVTGLRLFGALLLIAGVVLIRF
jgi:transporter family-2 protein